MINFNTNVVCDEVLNFSGERDDDIRSLLSKIFLLDDFLWLLQRLKRKSIGGLVLFITD